MKPNNLIFQRTGHGDKPTGEFSARVPPFTVPVARQSDVAAQPDSLVVTRAHRRMRGCSRAALPARAALDENPAPTTLHNVNRDETVSLKPARLHPMLSLTSALTPLRQTQVNPHPPTPHPLRAMQANLSALLDAQANAKPAAAPGDGAQRTVPFFG